MLYKANNTMPPWYFLPYNVPDGALKIKDKVFVYKGYVYKLYYKALPDEGFDRFFGQGDGRNVYVRESRYYRKHGTILIYAREHLLDRVCPLCQCTVNYNGSDLMCQEYTCAGCNTIFEERGNGITIIGVYS